MKKKNILLLGSTGSIGVNTLNVIRNHPEQFNIIGLSCGTNIQLLAEQIKEFKPEQVRIASNQKENLRAHLGSDSEGLIIHQGDQGNDEMTNNLDYDLLVHAIVGSKGVMPMYLAAKRGKNIALANKESIVLAGELVMPLIKSNQSKLYPIDSEHNAIFQALLGNDKNKIKKIILCATGGPFLNTPHSQFSEITLEQALNHPKWKMGQKITIDSATMMNKALEIIEAYWLFDITLEQIDVVIHPQALVHSFVEYIDHSIIAQMSHPDMKIPISFCLSENERITSSSQSLDLKKMAQMQFYEPDTKKFPTLQMAFETLKIGGGCPAFLNGANEALVDAFLKKRLQFIDIFTHLEKAIQHFQNTTLGTMPHLKSIASVDDAILANDLGSQFIQNQINQ